MRANFFSLLLLLCTLLASQAAPIDSHELSVSSRKAAPKPVPTKAAPKPVPTKAAPKPVSTKAAPKPVSTKAASKPVTTKAASKPVTTKAAPKPVSTKAAPKPVKTQPAAASKASKAVTTSKGAACPVPPKGSKAGVKARVNSDTEDCDGTSPAELCASFDNCADCVTAGAALQCAFDVKGGKCVPKTTPGLTLATSQKTCDTLLAAQQASAASAVDPRVTAAAQAAFSITIQDHIFKGTAAKKNSGRHILSAWKQANPKSAENKRNTATGIVEFQNGGDIKTVWNDVQAADNTFVYTQDNIKALCLRGYELSILANPSNAATLKAPAQPAASTSKKGKGKAPAAPAALKITSGLNNGFVVHNPFINQNVCINISSASCFPLGTGTASGAEGSSCTGDADVED
ncbi:hypothetical protein MSAN_01101600 [Mycena sanguinolenta]|uniref:Uncharacterized protein n=1 Tax=Mycena sanguinolenta TaxID=230812 RepID=A0A8H7DA17_9AGAR|nr:hypothetical protein MSAN_01101600 [Mycena sanguinolenta]